METRYKVVLLDMDGTFLDSRGVGEIPNEWAYEAFKKTVRHYGITLTVDEINTFFLAPLHSRGEGGVISFCDRFGLDCEEFWSRREEEVIEAKIDAIRSGVIKLCKGSEEIIRYLSERFDLAVVSDSQQSCVDYALEYFNLKPYFAIWYGRKSELRSLANRKPSPFYINKVLHELGVRKKESILVDDSPVGVLAAQRAGIDSVLICNNDEKLLKCEQKPTFLIRNLNELKTVL
jgi:HAD superfamily hydrolase (TIGR01509 family)